MIKPVVKNINPGLQPGAYFPTSEFSGLIWLECGFGKHHESILPPSLHAGQALDYRPLKIW